MRNLLLIIVLTVFSFLTPQWVSAQNGNGKTPVTITVSDNQGPVVGASVFEKGTTEGGITDMDGKTTILVSPQTALTVSFIGYITQEVKINGRSSIAVTLLEDKELLNEVVIVGYGVQKRESLTSAIAQISSDDITVTKSTDALETLQGKVPGLLIREMGGRPGQFNTELSLRGYGTPMIVVDGVVRNGSFSRNFTTPFGIGADTKSDISALQEINPEDIESISVLKDASATIYGLGAQNGVILITTKKGKENRPSVSWSSTIKLSTPTRIRKMEDWVSYMRWDNAMSDIAKDRHRYSEETIDGFARGLDGFNYTDWYKETTTKFAVTHQHNLAISGGSDKVTYRLSFGYANDGTILRTKNYGYDRYNFSGNLSANLTKNLRAGYTANIRMSNQTTCAEGGVDGNIWYYIYATDPQIGIHPIGNPSHFSNVSEQMNTIALLDQKVSGYNKVGRNSFQNTMTLDYQAPFLEGLSFNLSGAFDYAVNKTRNLIKNFDLYDYWTDEYVKSFRTENMYQEYWIDNTRLYGKAQATFDRTFGKHHVGSTLAAEISRNNGSNISGKRNYGATHADSFYTHDTISSGLASTSTNDGGRTSAATAGYIGRLTYDYAGKYLAEVMARYDGTYYYARGHRWGFFPSYSLGWRLSEEPFFKQYFPSVNNLKIRWSDGKTGSVQGMPYAYVPGYTATGSWVMNQGSNSKGWNSNTVENTILTWADVRMMDFGVDFEAWRGLFGFTFDWFKRITDGTAARRSVSLPDFYGVQLPEENLNANEVEGLELQLTHRNNIGQFHYSVSVNATYTRSRQTRIASEETKIYASSMQYWQTCVLNRWSNARSAAMYHWEGGQFTSLNDIASYPVLYQTSGKGNQELLAGMYKLADRDNNGYINENDRYFTWPVSNPPLQFGLIFSGNWKNLDFSMVFNGAALHSKQIQLHGYAGFGKLFMLPSEYADNCYHVAEYGADPWNPNTEWVSGYWPALVRVESAMGNHNISYTYAQPYNFVNATYLRLKSIEIGYRFSPSILKTVGIKNCRVYFNGGNLLTFCNKLLRPVDPESVDGGSMGGQFPLMKSYNFGLNLNF
ncbi:MAG: SusC/RagA family TonB-linked outer membrane protein [Bacteroidales bacterium]|nr:SusC/RagA family TonB-linked outer membrane protein [Bacteroidales bacterium]